MRTLWLCQQAGGPSQYTGRWAKPVRIFTSPPMSSTRSERRSPARSATSVCRSAKAGSLGGDRRQEGRSSQFIAVRIAALPAASNARSSAAASSKLHSPRSNWAASPCQQGRKKTRADPAGGQPSQTCERFRRTYLVQMAHAVASTWVAPLTELRSTAHVWPNWLMTG
jgi:hypothetical protein